MGKDILGKFTPRLPQCITNIKDADLAGEVANKMLTQLVQGQQPKNSRQQQKAIAEAQAHINAHGGLNFVNTPAGKVSRTLDALSDSWLGKILHGE